MLIYFSYILFGCYTIIVQVVCVREILVVVHGNELCLGLIFSCWLLGVAIGAAGMARVVDHIRRKRLVYQGFLLLTCLIFPAQIYGIRLLRTILRIAPGEFIPPIRLLIGVLGIIIPFSLCVGAIFPLVCSMFPRNEGRHIGRMYIAEALGYTAGGLLFTFVLVTRFHAFQLAALTGWALLLSAGFLSVRERTNKLPFAILIGLSTFYAYTYFSPISDILHTLTLRKRWQSFQQGIQLIKSSDSQYQHLTLGRQADQYVLFTNGQYTTAFPDEYEAAATAHFIMVQHPSPSSLLLIGGGAEGLIKEILKHPVNTLDYVELDSKLPELLMPYLSPEDREAFNDPRVSVHYTDGRYYVKHTRHRYDMVILNLPDPNSALGNRLYTQEFFQEVHTILDPGGILVTGLTASLHLEETAVNYAGALYKTLKRTFPYVFVTPGPRMTYFATSAPDAISLEPAVLGARYHDRHIQSEYFSEYHYESLLQSESLAFVQHALDRDIKSFQVNTDFQPISYFYNLLLWLQFSTSSPERLSHQTLLNIIQAVQHVSLWWAFPIFLCIVCIRLFLMLRVPRDNMVRKSHIVRQQRHNYLWAIGTTGFSGMALELSLMFAFQNMYGYIYHKVGLLVAVFMLGLVVGGYVACTFTKKETRSIPPRILTALLGVEIVLMLFAMVLPSSIRFLSLFTAQGFIESLIMLLVGVAGLLTGIEFPLANTLYARHTGTIGHTAGMLDSADHLGACCGALFIGAFSIPVFGLSASSYLVAFLKLSSIIFLVHEKFSFLKTE